MKDVSEKGYQQYCRSRPAASTDSNKRVKDMGFSSCGVHPLLRNNSKDIECQKENMLDQMRQYRPHGVRGCYAYIVLSLQNEKFNFKLISDNI